jgi:hypothetical protein
MPNTIPQSAGGKATGLIQKAQAAHRRAQYNTEPNYCDWCDKPILSKPTESLYITKTKRFCSRSCAASVNNRKRKTVIKPTQQREIIDWGLMTRKGLRDRSTSYQSARTTVRRHAYKAFVGHRECAICGYSTHIEVAHLRPVASFLHSATLNEINHPNNLIAFCPNHHWEFDNNCLI